VIASSCEAVAVGETAVAIGFALGGDALGDVVAGDGEVAVVVVESALASAWASALAFVGSLGIGEVVI